MKIQRPQQSKREDTSPPPGEECLELPLLLPAWQLALLERAASHQGLTVGQLLRRLIWNYLDGRHPHPSPNDTGCKLPVSYNPEAVARLPHVRWSHERSQP